MLVVLALLVPACGDSAETAGSESCLAIVEVGVALDEVRAAEGDPAGAAVRFGAARDAFERTVVPDELTVEWALAAEALGYYATSAGAPDTPRRSEAEVLRWQEAFGAVTAFGIDECGLGWRTPFDNCRQGSPPEDAAETRILFPCAT